MVSVEAEDGEQLDFLVSNGQGATFLSESVVQRLGESPKLLLGSVTVPTDEAIVLPDERLSSGGSSFHGIVGANTLNNFDVLFDAPAGKLVLKPVGGRVEWPGSGLSDPMPIQVYHGVALAMSVRVNGNDYRGTLDLGRPTSVANAGLADAEGLGAGGSVRLGLAGADQPDRPVEIDDLEIFQRWAPDGGPFIILGADVATRCAISISWAHQEIRTCTP